MHFQTNILRTLNYAKDLTKMCEFAIEYCNLDALKYIRARNVQCPWSYDMLDNIIEMIVEPDDEPNTPEKKNRIEIFKYIYIEDPSFQYIDPIDTFVRYCRIDLIKWVFDQNISPDNSWKNDGSYCIEAAHGGSLEVLQFLHKNKCPLHRTKCIITAENIITEWKNSYDFAKKAEITTAYENIIKWIKSLKDDDVTDSDVGECRYFCF